jgi:hypothetical protein
MVSLADFFRSPWALQANWNTTWCLPGISISWKPFLYDELAGLVVEVKRMLASLIQKLKADR